MTNADVQRGNNETSCVNNNPIEGCSRAFSQSLTQIVLKDNRSDSRFHDAYLAFRPILE